MKKIAVICLLLASLHAHADFVIEASSQTDAAKQPLTSTIKIKGNKIRFDNQGGQMEQGCMIVDLTGDGDIIMLFARDKTYMEMPGMAKLGRDEKAREAHGDAPAPAKAPELVDTGRQEKVGGYNAEIYTAEDTVRKIKFTYWISKEVPNYTLLKNLMLKSEQFAKATVQAQPPDTMKIDGIEVKTVVITTDKNGTSHTSTTTLVSVKETPVSDAEFQIPKGYKITGFN